MIQAIVKMTLVPDKQDAALNILKSVAQRTRAETGCIGCSIYQDTENNHAIVYEEIWRSKDELRQHLVREEYQKVLLVMEMAGLPPEIKFNTIKRTEGVEIIERARTFNTPEKIQKTP